MNTMKSELNAEEAIARIMEIEDTQEQWQRRRDQLVREIQNIDSINASLTQEHDQLIAVYLQAMEEVEEEIAAEERTI